MLDIQFIRDNPELVQRSSDQKQEKVDINKLLEVDRQRKNLLAEVEGLRAERNEISSKMKGGKPEPKLITQGKQIKELLSKKEAELGPLDTKFVQLWSAVPNIPTKDVPVGKTEAENVPVKHVGNKPSFKFTPKNHWEIGEQRGWIDKERAAKVAGARFAYLKGDLVRLEFGMWQFALEVLTNEKTLAKIAKANKLKVSSEPFVPVLPPAVAKTDVYQATGRLNGEEQTYKLADDELWLNASAEHVLAPMFQGEILEEADLPLRFVGYTTAFRREAGSYGKDMEGILRLHQFNKLEMESFTTKETSLDEHKFMIAIQEYLMQQLGLPYQVLMKCTADIGKPNARGVDIEAWLPAQNKYRETHTADYMTDYQARGLKTRVRRQDGEIELVHTNDATAFSERPLVAILENYQNKDGTVNVPTVLRPYLGGKKII